MKIASKISELKKIRVRSVEDFLKKENIEINNIHELQGDYEW